MDTQHPENNGPAVITPFTDLEKDDLLYNGYIISLQDLDIRWMYGDEPKFAAWDLGGNEVVLKYPSTSYTWLCDSTVEMSGRATASLDNPRYIQAQDVALHQVAADTTRCFKHVLFQFPMDEDEPEPLSNGILCPDAKDGKIKANVLPLVSKFKIKLKKSDIEATSARVDIEWYIAIIPKEDRPIKAKKKEKKNDLEDQVTDVFSKISLSGGGTP